MYFLFSLKSVRGLKRQLQYEWRWVEGAGGWKRQLGEELLGEQLKRFKFSLSSNPVKKRRKVLGLFVHYGEFNIKSNSRFCCQDRGSRKLFMLFHVKKVLKSKTLSCLHFSAKIVQTFLKWCKTSSILIQIFWGGHMVDQKFRHASNSILSRCHVSQRFDGGGIWREKPFYFYRGPDESWT